MFFYGRPLPPTFFQKKVGLSERQKNMFKAKDIVFEQIILHFLSVLLYRF